MSDQVDYGEYEAEEYTNMEVGGSQLDSTRFNQNFLQTDGCNTGGCENQENPGELPWLELMSAIPQANQTTNIKAKPSDMATPGDQEVSDIVAQLRGADGDKYAIGVIKEGWQEFSDTFESFERSLTTALEAMSLEWTGDDYESFAEQVQTVIGNLADLKEKIGFADGEGGGSGILALLEQKQSAIYELQGGGSGEVPYPAPLIWVDKREWYKTAEVHIRPAFWSNDCEIHGDAFANESGTDILKAAGFDPSYQDEVHNFTETRANYYYEYYNNEANGYAPGSFTMEQAQQLAQQDAESQVDQDASDIDEDYQQRLNNITNDVIGRRDLADDEVSGFQPDPPQSEETTLGDGGQPDMDYGPPGTGGGGGMPSAGGGLGDLNPPGAGTGIGSGDFNPPPGGIGGGSGGGGGGVGDVDNPWSSGITDPDDLSGGLAGGGTGGLGGGLGGGSGIGGGPGGGLGGGLGAGAGAGGLGAGGGVGGGMGRGGGTGAGAGAGGRGGMKGGGMGGGRGGGAGSGGRGMSGGMMGGGGGARGMGASENENSQDTWLVEDDDVWGIGNAEDDPYA